MPSHSVVRAKPIDLARFKLSRVEPAEGALRVGIVAARFNADIVDALLEGTLRTLAAHDVRGDDVVLARVAGAWELAQVAQAMADSGEIDAIVALGCIIRGETSHYDVIVNESARALMDVALKSGIAISNGVLAVENVGQALARCGGEHGHKGEEAALAALETAGLIRSLLPEDFDLDGELDGLLDEFSGGVARPGPRR